MNTFSIPQAWHTPSAEFSLAPFWFWNDDLDEHELSRQLDEFQAHGVDAFVIHPRVGLPRDLGWMSQPLLGKMRFVIEEADKRGMWVILYDEGMYPSGSSSGQVVAENPAYQCRGLVRIDLDEAKPNATQSGVKINADSAIELADNQTLVAEVTYKGTHYAIVDRPIDTIIRGLHFVHEDADEPPEDEPLATDLLNPEAVACFIRLVYDRYYDEFGQYFGNTIPAIFTDEPMLLGRSRETGIMPGTTGILDFVNTYLGYDFTPNLPALWDENAPKSIRDDYERAVEARLEETYYTQLFTWCEAHNIALTGHPAEPDATRHLRYFHFPGQDIVWRQIEPAQPSSLEGRQSTQGKAASSMMLHTGRRRNANEFCGAFGHNLTFEEMRWLANWLLIRGCNLLIPHAFYYSVRGPRKHERPPDVGLHSNWWDERFTRFARACRRLCWLNTDSQQVCYVAVLGEHHHLPWRATKACFQNQIDFNYLDGDDLMQNCNIRDNAIHIADQAYKVLVVDGEITPEIQGHLATLEGQVSIIHWSDDTERCINELKSLLPEAPFYDVQARGLRVRHVSKDGFGWYILFNEEATTIKSTLILGNAYILNPYSDEVKAFTGDLFLEKHELCVLVQKRD